jgi:hypothetical protein
VIPVASFREGVPIELPRDGITVIFRRIPDDYAPLAGPDGVLLLIKFLQQVDAMRRSRS